MSELKRNIVSNFKRYTDGKNKVEYIVKLAMYSALAFVLYNTNANAEYIASFTIYSTLFLPSV